jgi:hypothetical protein
LIGSSAANRESIAIDLYCSGALPELANFAAGRTGVWESSGRPDLENWMGVLGRPRCAKRRSTAFAVPLVRYLGEAGVNVLLRLSAFILVCIGIQIGCSGLSALFAGLQHPVALP